MNDQPNKRQRLNTREYKEGERVKLARWVNGPKFSLDRAGVVKYANRREDGTPCNGALVLHDNGKLYGWAWHELELEVVPTLGVSSD